MLLKVDGVTNSSGLDAHSNVLTISYSFLAGCVNRRRRYAWVFYTWWSRAEELQNQRLLEQIVCTFKIQMQSSVHHWMETSSATAVRPLQAIQHQDRCNVRMAWRCWRRRMEQQREKQTASDHMYQLLETLSQRKESSMDAQSRSDEGEQRQCYRYGLEFPIISATLIFLR